MLWVWTGLLMVWFIVGLLTGWLFRVGFLGFPLVFDCLSCLHCVLVLSALFL